MSLHGHASAASSRIGAAGVQERSYERNGHGLRNRARMARSGSYERVSGRATLPLAAGDGQRPLHPELIVAVELAHEGVCTCCERDRRVLGEARHDGLDFVDDLVALED